MTPLKHTAYRVTQAHTPPALAAYPALCTINLHLDQEYTDADLAPWTAGNQEGYIDFESPGMVPEAPDTFSAVRIGLAIHAVQDLKLAPEDGPHEDAQNCIGIYPVGGGGDNYNPLIDQTYYEAGAAMTKTLIEHGLYHRVDWVGMDVYFEDTDPLRWFNTFICNYRAAKATGKPIVVFICPRLITDEVSLVPIDLFASRGWTINSMFRGKDFAAVCYWDNPPSTDPVVLAAADAHAAKFAEVFPL